MLVEIFCIQSKLHTQTFPSHPSLHTLSSIPLIWQTHTNKYTLSKKMLTYWQLILETFQNYWHMYCNDCLEKTLKLSKWSLFDKKQSILSKVMTTNRTLNLKLCLVRFLPSNVHIIDFQCIRHIGPVQFNHWIVIFDSW